MIALIGYHDDEDLLRMVEALRARGRHVLFLGFGHTSPEYAIRWHSDSLPEIWFRDRGIGLRVLERVSCVITKWWRMDDHPLVRCDIGNCDENRFAEREWSALVRSILKSWQTSYHGLWIGQLIDFGIADLKPYYLEQALRFGMLVPAFCINTEFEPPLAGRALVAKALNKDEMIDTKRHFRTSRLDTSTIDQLLGRRAECPTFLQCLVERRREKRVLVCGEEVVVIDMTSEENEVDIRFAERVSISTSDGEGLPTEKILLFCKASGLTLCTLDFVVDSDNAPWLVDVTPNGSWSWFEGQGRDITNAIVDCICKQQPQKGGSKNGEVERQPGRTGQE